MMYSFVYLIPLLVLLGSFLGGAFSYLGVAYVFLVHPFADNFLFKKNMPNSSSSQLNHFILLGTFPIFFFCFFLSFYFFNLRIENAPLYEKIGFILSLGSLSGGVGINTAHELIHRKNAFHRWLGVGLLTPSLYTHWAIEHVYGHHKNVATPLDPASARINESVYSFFLRSSLGTLVSAFKISIKYNLIKKLLGGFLFQSVLLLIIFFFFRDLFVIFFLQAFVGFFLLEVINYIEHYGLSRKETRPGFYEPVGENHSWDSYSFLTNASLFNLGFHSNHHVYANKEYERLSVSEKSMKLPYGYSLMFLIALLPPLWFSILNKKINTQF